MPKPDKSSIEYWILNDTDFPTKIRHKMKVRAYSANSTQELKTQLKEILQNEFRPTLAIAFASLTLDLNQISHLFNQMDIDVLGYSTAGEINNDEIHDGVVCGLLFDIGRDCYQIYMEEYLGKTPFEACHRLGIKASECFPCPALIVGSGGVAVDAEQIVFGIKAGVGREVPIFGGLAADDLRFEYTIAFTRYSSTQNGIVALVIDNEKIEVSGLATSGWQGVGMENVVTKAEGNVVYTINNEPALDAFIKYFGYFDNSEVKGKSISSISAQYPLQIMREDGSTILRSPLIGSEVERTLILAGGVRQGDKFRFSISPGFEVIDQTIEEFGELHRSIGQVEGLILFSCKGRHAALGPLIEDEIKGIFNYWKKPMAGFFTYGEIGPTQSGVCEFHNETCSLVLLRERSGEGA